jgi:hypothetical protein
VVGEVSDEVDQVQQHPGGPGTGCADGQGHRDQQQHEGGSSVPGMVAAALVLAEVSAERPVRHPSVFQLDLGSLKGQSVWLINHGHYLYRNTIH